MSANEYNSPGFTKQFGKDVNGVHTEFVFHMFPNKWLLLLTQFGRLPAMYSVTFDVKRDDRVLPAIHGPVDNPDLHVSVPITMNCCLGADTDEVRSAIQFLVNKTTLNKCPSEFVIGLGLKQIDGKNLRLIAQILNEEVLK